MRLPWGTRHATRDRCFLLLHNGAFAKPVCRSIATLLICQDRVFNLEAKTSRNTKKDPILTVGEQHP
jgi:hypothetical protein